MKLGKTPARPGAVKLKLATYLDVSTLPKVPVVFGHEGLVTSYGMNGNDQFGDCVWAGAAHETEVWNREAGRTVAVSTVNSLSDYAAVTGFNPSDPSTDQGTDMQVAASYRRKVGVVDATGARHKVAAYAALAPGNVTELATAAYLFGAVGIGIKFPSFAMDQFNAGRPWATKRGRQQIDGGHYVPVLGRVADGNFVVVTWGHAQEMTPGFYEEYCDEALVYLSDEALTGGRSPEGFNHQQLLADLSMVTRR